MFLFNGSLSILFFALFLLFTFFIFILFQVLNLKELGWKLIYLGINWVLYFFLFYSFSNNILFILSGDIQEALVIKDVQEYTNILISVALFFSSLFTSLNFFLYLYIFFLNIYHKHEMISMRLFLFLFCYFFCVGFFIVNHDLCSSSWDIFSSWKDSFFDFQPNLEFIFYAYKGEFYDFFMYLMISFFIYFYFFVLYKGERFFSNYFKYFFNIFFLLSNIYFFGGDGIVSDLCIIFWSLFYFEFIFFVLCFFSVLKRKKK